MNSNSRFVFKNLEEIHSYFKNIIEIHTNYFNLNSNIYYSYNETDILLVIKQIDVLKNYSFITFIFDKNIFNEVKEYFWKGVYKNGKIFCTTSVFYQPDSKIKQNKFFPFVFYNKYNEKLQFIPKDKNIHNLKLNNYEIIILDSKNKNICNQTTTETELKNYPLLYTNASGKNKYYIYDDNILILVIKLANILYKVLLDKDDFEKVKKYQWFTHRDKSKPEHNRYVLSHFKINNMDKLIRLHRYILNLEKQPEIIIDHINRNPLDNRKNNLRIATHTINNRNQSIRKNNSSGVTGVRFNKRRNRWGAKRDIYESKTKKVLKSRGIWFNNMEDAVIARKKLELIPDEIFLSSKGTLIILDELEKQDFFKDINL